MHQFPRPRLIVEWSVFILRLVFCGRNQQRQSSLPRTHQDRRAVSPSDRRMFSAVASPPSLLPDISVMNKLTLDSVSFCLSGLPSIPRFVTHPPTPGCSGRSRVVRFPTTGLSVSHEDGRGGDNFVHRERQTETDNNKQPRDRFVKNPHPGCKAAILVTRNSRVWTESQFRHKKKKTHTANNCKNK